jgi:hypothetical protein
MIAREWAIIDTTLASSKVFLGTFVLIDTWMVGGGCTDKPVLQSGAKLGEL